MVWVWLWGRLTRTNAQWHVVGRVSQNPSSANDFGKRSHLHNLGFGFWVRFSRVHCRKREGQIRSWGGGGGRLCIVNGGALSAVQLFGRVAVLETHALR